MLAFGTGFLIKISLDIVFGGLLAIALNWKRFKTHDLILLMSNGTSVLNTCMNSLIRAILIVVQSLGANFWSIVVLSVISFAMHEYTSDTLSLIDASYTKFYIFVYRRIIESYGWLARVLYEMFVPLTNLSAFLTKKLLIRDLAENFATCQNKPRFGLTIFFETVKLVLKFVGQFLEQLFTWLLSFATEELDLRSALSTLQEIPIEVMKIMPCACESLSRPFSSVARLISTKTFVELLHNGMNLPVRFFQIFTQGFELEALQTLTSTISLFCTHLGNYLDDIVEEVIGLFTESGFAFVQRPFVFGLLSYVGTAMTQVGHLGVSTMITAAHPKLDVTSETLNVEPVFAELHKLAFYSGAPLETFIQFGQNELTTKHSKQKPYCPLFDHGRETFVLETQKCRCQLNCGTLGQCYNNVLCVPYYENIGSTLHGIPGKSHTPIIMKCENDNFCENGGTCIDGRCLCPSNFVISYATGKCLPQNTTQQGACNPATTVTGCARALRTHTMQENCLFQDSVDAPVGNPFSCIISSAFEGIVGGFHVVSSISKKVVLKPTLLQDIVELMEVLNDHLGGVSYRSDLSCEFRSANSAEKCDCSNSPYCGKPTITHNVVWPFRRAAFYAGLGMTHGVSVVQDWLGAAITSFLNIFIDVSQAVIFTALNLFDGFRNLEDNAFKKPFDVHTPVNTATLCVDTKYQHLGLCTGTQNRCIAWWYDGENPAIRNLFYQEREHWCGSLVAEPIIMRADELVQSFANFLQRATTGNFGSDGCSKPQYFDTDSLTYINVLFDANGQQLQTSKWELFAPKSNQWCRTEWHPSKFSCDLSQALTTSTSLLSNIIRQMWRNTFAVVFYHQPQMMDIDIQHRVCDAYQAVNSATGLAGNTIGSVAGSEINYRVSHALSISSEFLYGPLATLTLFVSEQVHNLFALTTTTNLAEFLDDTVINTIIFVSRFVFVQFAKVLQLLQVIAFGNLHDGKGRKGDAGEFVRSMYTLLESFAKFFNKHGVRLMRILLEMFSGILQIIQGHGAGELMHAFKNFLAYATQVIKEIWNEFFPWLLKVLGPIGDLLEFTEDFVCGALQLVGDAIKTVIGMIKPAGAVLDSIGLGGVVDTLSSGASSVLGSVADGIDSVTDQLPLGVGAFASFMGPKKLRLGISVLSFMGDIDGTIDFLKNLNLVCDLDRSADDLNAASRVTDDDLTQQRRSGPFVHRRRRTARRLFESQNTTDVEKLFTELNSKFDWSGTTHCAMIGQIKKPPQTPYEIAAWTTCVEYRIRAAAVSSIIDVPGNIFDDWYSLAEWSSLMVLGGFQYMTTNATIEDLAYAGYPSTAIMQVTEGAKKIYTGLYNKFSLDDAIDATFYETGFDTTDLKSIVHDFPVFEIPAGGEDFAHNVANGVDDILHTVRKFSDSGTEPREEPRSTAKRRLLLHEETFQGVSIEIPRGLPLWKAVNPLEVLDNCPLLTGLLTSFKDMAVVTGLHYSNNLPQTINQFYLVMRTHAYDADPLFPSLKKPNNDGIFRIPPYTSWATDTFYNGEDDTTGVNWHMVSPSEAVQAVTDFFKISGAKETLSIPLLESSAWDWLLEKTKTCDYKDIMYDKCSNATASIKHTKQKIVQVGGFLLGLSYVAPSPLSSVVIFMSPGVLFYTFLNERYGYTPFCAPLLPVCAARDLQLILHDTFSIEKCFCQTSVGQALMLPNEKCKNCVFYNDISEQNKIEYRSCPKRRVPAPLWAPLQALAWQFPKVFNFMFRSLYSPLRFVGTDNFLADFAVGDQVSGLDKACVYVFFWDIPLVLIVLPMLASLLVFMYGQSLSLGIQLMVWFGTILALLKPKPSRESYDQPKVAGNENVVKIPIRETLPNNLRRRIKKKNGSQSVPADVP